MPRTPRFPPPIYPRDGKDYVRYYPAPKQPREKCLGPSGSEEARAAYARFVAELAARRVPAPASGTLIAEVCAGYLDEAAQTCESRTYRRLKMVLGRLADAHGDQAATALDLPLLESFRADLVGAGYARLYVNDLINRVRQVWSWAARKRLVPALVSAALKELPGLYKGQKVGVVRAGGQVEWLAPTERARRRPAEPEAIEQALAAMWPIHRDMARLQLCTAMRPSEVCQLRPCDLERDWRVVEGVAIWLYRLDEHKTDWRGHYRWIPLGPQAQALLAPYLKRAPEAYCFSPRESLEWIREHLHKGPGFGCRQLGARFAASSYSQAVRRACERAGVSWTPYQLRHAVGTEVGAEHDQDTARCVLGQRSLSATMRYTEEAEKAARVAARRG